MDTQSVCLDLSATPNFCAHEHWGSIASIGSVPEGFRADVECGATPASPTSVLDLLLDPYFGGCLWMAGEDWGVWASESGETDFWPWARMHHEAVWAKLWPAIERQRFVGMFQCIRRGVLALYDVDLAEGPPPEDLNAAIAKNYEHIFDWYQTVMGRAHFTKLIRPVHPEFYIREESPDHARRERAFTHTVMRIDPLLEFWPEACPRRDALAANVRVIPKNAESWRAFIAAVFDLAADRGALGIKQAQAYSRTLEFLPREDREVQWSGDLTPEHVRTFQDWVVHECCRQAEQRGWPHQIHVGTHNLRQSSPLPLEILAQRYPRMNIVMLHCWPYLEEAGALAKGWRNVYIDTCWQCILNPAFFKKAMSMWINYVPLHKIACSNDATSVEMAVGAATFAREILAQVLLEQRTLCGATVRDLEEAALSLLHNNAAALYGIV